jgi:hypothetical protein
MDNKKLKQNMIATMSGTEYIQELLYDTLAEGRTIRQSILAVKTFLFEQKTTELPLELQALNKDQLTEEVERSYEKFPRQNKEIFEAIENSQCIYAVHGDKKNRYLVSKDYKLKIFSVEFFAAKQIKNKYRLQEVTQEFRPKLTARIFEENGEKFINRYTPPDWLYPYFYTNTLHLVPKVNQVPPIVQKLLVHLTNNDEASINYLLNWCANIVQGNKNKTFLTAFGPGGVGKGVLFEILRKILGGTRNVIQISQNQLTSHFNADFHNKQLINLNEVSLENSETLDIVKQLNEKTMVVEGKGVDRHHIQNQANIYLSSNRIDSLDVTALDRRFSLISLNDAKLETSMSQEEIVLLHDSGDELAPEILQFAHYLYTKDLSGFVSAVPFVSKYIYKLVADDINNTNWKRLFFYNICQKQAGRTIPLNEVAELIKTELKDNNLDTNATRNKITQEKIRALVYMLNKLNVCDIISKSKKGQEVQFFPVEKHININDKIEGK